MSVLFPQDEEREPDLAGFQEEIASLCLSAAGSVARASPPAGSRGVPPRAATSLGSLQRDTAGIRRRDVCASRTKSGRIRDDSRLLGHCFWRRDVVYSRRQIYANKN
jgi:hypothetical protein